MVLPCVALRDQLDCLKLLHKQSCRGQVFLFGQFLDAPHYMCAVQAINVSLSMLSAVGALKLLKGSASSERNNWSPSIFRELCYSIQFASCSIELHLEVALVVAILAKFALTVLHNGAPLALLAVWEGIDLCSPLVQNHGVKSFDVGSHGC